MDNKKQFKLKQLTRYEPEVGQALITSEKFPYHGLGIDCPRMVSYCLSNAATSFSLILLLPLYLWMLQAGGTQLYELVGLSPLQQRMI